MTLFHGRWSCVFLLALVATGACSAQATDDGTLAAGLVFDALGSEYCQPAPPEMSVGEIETMLGQAIETEAAPLRGRMQGFMEGERVGLSVFGTRSEDAGLAVVSSVLGPHPAGGHATLCLAMIQLGDVPAVPGTYAVVGASGLDDAAPGDVLVVGWLVRLEATGRQGDGGRDLHRLANLGPAHVSGGSFTLISIDGERFEASLEIRGDVRAGDAPQATGFSLEATSWGGRGLDRIPSLTLAP